MFPRSHIVYVVACDELEKFSLSCIWYTAVYVRLLKGLKAHFYRRAVFLELPKFEKKGRYVSIF